MTYRIKVPPRTLPVDEAHLMSNLEHRLASLRDYRWPLLVGFGLVILVGAIVWGVLWYEAQSASKAQDIEREANLHYFTRPANDPKKADTNLKEAIALYKRIVDEYPRTPSAPLALFSLGNAFLQAKEIDPAIEAYKRLVSTYGSNVPLLGLVHQKLGYAYLLKGEHDQAAKAYATVLEIPGALNRDHAMFELARLEEGRSKLEGALAYYQDLIKTYPSSPFASEAAIRVKVLDAKKSTETTPVPSDTPATSAAPKSPAKP